LLAVAPSWTIATLLSIPLRPLHFIGVHLVVLALLGWLCAEIGLINFYKVPFTCTWLPGKVHVMVLFGCALVLLVVFGLTCSELELPALSSPARSIFMVLLLAGCCCGLFLFNNHRARRAKLYFEEFAPEIITSLRIGPLPRQTDSALLR
jgi:UDP-N-acetylmuramyl pentapeptide phosphotransferase/UDP-N-acetylglucosamine-1-phosphate transferase